MVWLAAGASAFGQSIRTPNDLLEVPLHDDGVGIKIAVELFGKTSYFAVDTGTTCSMLDLVHREKLGKPIGEGRLATPLLSEEKIFCYDAPRFFIGTFPVRLKRVSSVDLSNFSLISGEPWGGILGLDFISQHVVCLDFDRKVLAIGTQVSRAVKTSAITVPLTYVENLGFLISGLVEGVPISLLIDTGTSRSLALSQADWDKISAAKHNIATQRSVLGTVNSEFTQTMVAQIGALEIQTQKYTGLPATVMLTSPGPSTIGLPFFRRHIVVLDFPQKLLYLLPGAHFDDEDRCDMSGLHILRSDGQTYVHSVDPGSPAGVSGVKQGDVLISVRGRNVSQMPLRDVRDEFKTANGDKVRLKMRRGEKEISIEIVLVDVFGLGRVTPPPDNP